jgi:hypothetical protein
LLKRVTLLFDNNLDAALVFTVLFLGLIVSLLFLLAWLEQPASERWRPGRRSPSRTHPAAAAPARRSAALGQQRIR